MNRKLRIKNVAFFLIVMTIAIFVPLRVFAYRLDNTPFFQTVELTTETSAETPTETPAETSNEPTSSPTATPTTIPTNTPSAPQTVRPTTTPTAKTTSASTTKPTTIPSETPSNLVALSPDLKSGTEIVCVSYAVKLIKEPTNNSQIVLFLSEGDKLIFLDWTGSWVKAKIGEIEGYVDYIYLRYDPNNLTISEKTPLPTSTEIMLTPEPTLTLESAVPPISTPIIVEYNESQNNQSVFEKLSRIPIWFYVLVVGLLILIIILFIIKRK